MKISRDAIVDALFNVMTDTARFQTIGRDVIMWDQVNAQPALFLGEARERIERQSPLAPPRLTMMIELFVYAKTDKDKAVPRGRVLNNLLDVIDAALAPSAGADLVNKRQTLGGLVYHCYVDGEILKDPGYLDGQGIALVPVKIIAP